jgi:type II secretory pathway component GspD/PulD (secretin)
VPISINAAILALEQNNQSHNLAEPIISLIDGGRGYILIGDRIQYPKLTGYTTTNSPIYDVQEVRVGVYVQVSAEILDKGDVILTVYPQVSTISSVNTVNGAEYPNISTREEQTTVRVHDKDTLVIGGLISSDELQNLQMVPILGKIPILGELFKYRRQSKTKTDLVITITPEVFDPPL